MMCPGEDEGHVDLNVTLSALFSQDEYFGLSFHFSFSTAEVNFVNNAREDPLF